MSKIIGYVGGDGQPQLLAALKEALAVDVADAWEKIRTKYMYIGSIIAIAKSKGYIKKSRLGFAGYMITHVGYGEKTCRDCLRCWEKRRDFDAVRDWVPTANGLKPGKTSGPILYLDSHKAWSNRLKTGPATTRPKALSAKELRKVIEAYRGMLDRVGGEHVKQAEINQFEPKVWNAVVQERSALEAEMSKTVGDPSAFPVDATRDEVNGDDENQYKVLFFNSEQTQQPQVDMDEASSRVSGVMLLTGPESASQEPTEAEPESAEPHQSAAEPKPTDPQPAEPFEPVPELDGDMDAPNFWSIRFGAVPLPDVAKTEMIEKDWDIKAFGGGNVKPERRLLARQRRARAFWLLGQTAGPYPHGAALEKQSLKTWLRNDIDDLNLLLLLALKAA